MTSTVTWSSWEEGVPQGRVLPALSKAEGAVCLWERFRGSPRGPWAAGPGF